MKTLGASTHRLSRLLGIVVFALATAPAAAAPQGGALLKESVGSFVLDASRSSPAPPVTVWYYRPGKIDSSTRVVFLMHGSSRTGREAREIGTPYAEKHGFVLLAPEFSEAHYPGDSYAFGNMLDPEGKPVPEERWGFATIERLFDVVRDELHLSAGTYDILGHSAGGQFVQRLVLFAPRARFRRAVASSPGRYAMPTMSRKFPYGFDGSPLDASFLRHAFSRDFVLVLGDKDTDDRDREVEAMQQGGNRFARGLRFFATATEEANTLKAPLEWRLRIAAGVDHSPVRAVQADFEELF